MLDLHYEAKIQAIGSRKYCGRIDRNGKTIWQGSQEFRTADDARLHANAAMSRIEHGNLDTEDGKVRGYKYMKARDLS